MLVLEKPGVQNTEAVIRAAVEEAEKQGIKYIAVATTTGKTADYFSKEEIEKFHIVLVTTAYGTKEPGKNQMDESTRKTLQEKGFTILSATHALSGVERAISGAKGGMYPAEIMANTLRMLGQGTKVIVEIAAMAVDAGCLPEQEPVVVLGGSSHGSDTAAVLRASGTSHIFDTKIDKYIAKPVLE
ncbi:MAG: pyruvate kinase alpha/beta domain-containing protein [Lachnospiraceae bacterium]